MWKGYICRLYWTKVGYLNADRSCNRTHMLPLPRSAPCNHAHDIYMHAAWCKGISKETYVWPTDCYLQNLRHQLWTSNETRSSPALVTAAWILPISVLIPVATTQAVHAPLDTVVDEKSTFIFSCEMWANAWKWWVNDNNYGSVMAKSGKCGNSIFHYVFCNFTGNCDFSLDYLSRKCNSAVRIQWCKKCIWKIRLKIDII